MTETTKQEIELFLKIYSGVIKYRYMLPLFTSGVKNHGLKSTDVFVIRKKPSDRLAVLNLGEIAREDKAVCVNDELIAVID